MISPRAFSSRDITGPPSSVSPARHHHHHSKHSMTLRFTLFSLTPLIAGPLCFAQESPPPKDDWKPAPTNQRGREYPQVNSEGRVKFRIVAPQAQSVGVSFRDSSPFTKGEDGAWIGYSRP